MNLLLAISLTWVVGTEADIRRTCYEITGKYAVACAVLREDGSCTVYAPKFRNDRDDKNFARLGEEVAHCFYGDFHLRKEYE